MHILALLLTCALISQPPASFKVCLSVCVPTMGHGYFRNLLYMCEMQSALPKLKPRAKNTTWPSTGRWGSENLRCSPCCLLGCSSGVGTPMRVQVSEAVA